MRTILQFEASQIEVGDTLLDENYDSVGEVVSITRDPKGDSRSGEGTVTVVTTSGLSETMDAAWDFVAVRREAA